MLFGFLVTLFVIVCAMLILLILVQKGKSSTGLGGLGGGSQMLFGGSGGQDIFQKITWVLTVFFMGGSLVLALMKSNNIRESRYVTGNKSLSTIPVKKQAAAQQPLDAQNPSAPQPVE
jgi:preprotein translocase subunit SecG